MTSLERKVNALIAVVTAEDEESKNSALSALQNIDVQAAASMEEEVGRLLTEVGVPCHIGGFDYLVKGICLIVQNPDLRHEMTKGLYPAIAKEFAGKTASRVERAIRHAVEVAFDRCDIDVLAGYFGNTIDPEKAKPTNGEFISVMARELKRRCI